MHNLEMLDNKEIIKAVWRRHWISLAPIMAASLILLSAISYSFGWVAANPEQVSQVVAPALVNLVLSFLMILIGLIAAASWWIYRQNRLFLTNDRLVQILQQGLFSQSTLHLDLDNVQDVRASHHGFLATLFNFGEIQVDTAGAEKNFRFQYAPNPRRMAQDIMQAADTLQRSNRHELHAAGMTDTTKP